MISGRRTRGRPGGIGSVSKLTLEWSSTMASSPVRSGGSIDGGTSRSHDGMDRTSRPISGRQRRRTLRCHCAVLSSRGDRRINNDLICWSSPQLGGARDFGTDAFLRRCREWDHLVCSRRSRRRGKQHGICVDFLTIDFKDT